MLRRTVDSYPPGRISKSTGRLPRWWRRGLRWLLKLRGSPTAIARGAAIGVFIAFMPLMGVQMIVAVLLATLLSANRPIAAAGVWITNPLTMGPLYALCYWVGSLIWPGPPVAHVRDAIGRMLEGLTHLDAWELWDQLVAFMGIGRDVLIPLTLGGVLVGAVAAVPTYVVTLVVAQRVRRLRLRRRA